ncbi:uncharacterized protein [Anoplolepis gracilipes]|uniref:uncharacterized protein n=1 Tax=Anoplolepis gracilipes TaxID=354296 RepID=UPI003BA13135
MNDDISRDVAKDVASTIEHHVMDILNPTLHHHDLLQSYVRVEIDSDSKQDVEEFEEPIKEAHSSKYPTKANDSDSRKDNFRNDSRKKKNNDKTVKEKSDTTVESEMRIQKSKRKRQYDSEGRRQEEMYTDKDRAAAVNMGTTDIKQSLKMKQCQLRSRILQIPEETKPGALLTLGLREMRFGDFNTAISCINKALGLNPGDKNALIARSKCHLLLGNPQRALDDAEAALRLNPEDSNIAKAIYCKAEALYHLGDFEMSLMYYYRGMKMRPEFSQFRLGVQKAKDAIQNVLCKN